jgi:hypothetical protein
MYSRRNKSFGMKHHFSSAESEQFNMITPLAFATGLSLNQAGRLPIQSNPDDTAYGRQQMLKEQYIKMSINRASTICGHANMVIHQ